MCCWVSVNDLIPEAFESVLLYMPNEAPLPKVHEGYYANGNWYRFSGDVRKEEVTHWAPMPLGPEIE